MRKISFDPKEVVDPRAERSTQVKGLIAGIMGRTSTKPERLTCLKLLLGDVYPWAHDPINAAIKAVHRL